MSNRTEARSSHPRSSRTRYRDFVQDYRLRRLDERTDAGRDTSRAGTPARADQEKLAATWRSLRGGRRREFLREYVSWLWPHRIALVTVFVLALATAGLEMIEPLFMRFIVDRVLLNATLDTAARMPRLHVAGAAFLVLSRAADDHRRPLSRHGAAADGIAGRERRGSIDVTEPKAVRPRAESREPKVESPVQRVAEIHRNLFMR